MGKQISMDRLGELIDQLEIARSTIFVSACALDHGETDLELQSATGLKQASDALDEVYDTLVSMRTDAQSPTRPKAAAAR